MIEEFDFRENKEVQAAIRELHEATVNAAEEWALAQFVVDLLQAAARRQGSAGTATEMGDGGTTTRLTRFASQLLSAYTENVPALENAEQREQAARARFDVLSDVAGRESPIASTPASVSN